LERSRWSASVGCAHFGSLVLFTVVAAMPVLVYFAAGHPDRALYYVCGVLIWGSSVAVLVWLLGKVRELQAARLAARLGGGSAAGAPIPAADAARRAGQRLDTAVCRGQWKGVFVAAQNATIGRPQ
jgi:hypothetical protein